MTPKKKISHWNQSKWRRKQSRTFRQGSVRSRPGCQKRQATMTTLQERGPEGARRRPPRTPGQGPSTPPRLGPRWGGDGLAWGGDAGTDSLHAAPRPPGGDPGASVAEPTPTHTPLRPRPTPPEAGPTSHREPRERPRGAGRARGADSGAQAGRRAPRTDLGLLDASTQTQ